MIIEKKTFLLDERRFQININFFVYIIKLSRSGIRKSSMFLTCLVYFSILFLPQLV